MDGFVKNLSSPTRSDLKQRTHSFEESNENELGSKSQNLKRTEAKKHFMLPTVSAASKASLPRKKVLAELESNSFDTHLPRTPKTDPLSPTLDLGSPITTFSSKISDSDHSIGDLGSNSYDPLTNYLSPRPKFLRYNPNRRAEILHRRESELRKGGDGLGGITEQKKMAEEEEEESFSYSSSPSSVSHERPINQEEETSPASNELMSKPAQNKDEEGEDIGDNDDEEEEEVEEEDGSSSWKKVLKFMIVLGVLFSSTLYISSMNSPTKPSSLQPLWGLQERFGMIQNHVIGVVSNDFVKSSVFLHQFDEKGENFMEIDEGGENGEIVGEVMEESGEVLDQMEVLGRENAETCDADMGVEKLILYGTEVKSDDSDPVKDEAEVVMTSEVNELPSEEASIEEIRRGEVVNSEVEKVFDVKNEEVDEAELITGEDQLRVEATEVISSELNELPSGEVSNQAIENEVEEASVEELGEGFSLDGEETEFSEVPQTESMEISDHITVSDSERFPEVEVIADQGIMIVTLVVSLLSLVALSRFLKLLYRCWRKHSAKQIPPATELPVESTIVEERVCGVHSALPTQENVIEHQVVEVAKSCANPSASSVHSEGKGSIQLYQSQAPRVELLGEYVVDRRMSTSVKSCNVKPRVVESEESNFSQTQEKKPRRKAMSVPTQEHQSLSGFSATDSHSYGLVTLQEKILIREEGRGGEEAMKVVTTPVRRSSRIRNRVTSPL